MITLARTTSNVWRMTTGGRNDKRGLDHHTEARRSRRKEREDFSPRISGRMAKRLVVILDALDTIEAAEEMNIAGLYLHQLKGQQKGSGEVNIR